MSEDFFDPFLQECRIGVPVEREFKYKSICVYDSFSFSFDVEVPANFGEVFDGDIEAGILEFGEDSLVCQRLIKMRCPEITKIFAIIESFFLKYDLFDAIM